MIFQSITIKARSDNFESHRIDYSEVEIHTQKVLDMFPHQKTQALGNLRNAKGR